MTPTTALPYELLLDCFDFAGILNHPLNIFLPDYKFLLNLSLVSKQISGYAQKIIFRSVFLSRNKQALAFGNAVNSGTAKGRWLGGLVTNLKAIVSDDHRGGLTQKLFMASLLACSNLRELDLDVVDTVFDTSTFSGVFAPHPSPIHTLRLATPTFTSPCEILNVFPSLMFVEFKCPIRRPLVPLGSSPACKLAEIHWNGSIDDYLLLILQNSVGYLEILSVQNLSTRIDDAHFERLMSIHGISLRSLHIPSLPDSQIASLRHCTQLEELIIDSMVHKVAFAALPETLEHLKIQFLPENNFHLQLLHTGGRVEPSQVVSSLVHFVETAPSLLTFTLVDGSRSTPSFTKLRESCHRRGIVWRTWHEPYGVYPGERQELGYVDTFPRALPLSPLRLQRRYATTSTQESL